MRTMPLLLAAACLVAPTLSAQLFNHDATVTLANVTHSITGTVTVGANGVVAVLTATNVTTPATNWPSLGTNQFDASGHFSFTNGINPNELQRYFRHPIP